jgi:diaminopimelate epimerase
MRLPAPVFHKYQALGNDYIVLDPRDCKLEVSPPLVRRLCDRHFGVGADGVLFGPTSEMEPFAVVIYNADGSTAEKSGNGLRIFARYLHDHGYFAQPDFRLLVGTQVVAGTRLSGGSLIRLDMGVPQFATSAIPVSTTEPELLDSAVELPEGTTLRISCVSMGNPHCVVMDPGFSTAEVMRLGALLETHPLFPARTNVQFLVVRDRRHIGIRIWERGSGYTLSSGSSSCAAAAVARRLGLVDATLTVEMEGGAIEVTFQPNGAVLMTGEVAHVATGRLAPDFMATSARNGASGV